MKVTCGQVWWPILEMCTLLLTHPSAHTEQWTHTHTHTPWTHIQWAANASAPGEQLGVRCLAQGHLSRGVEGGERECWLFTPPTDNSCQIWDSNPQPSSYKSDSLSNKPRLPLMAQIPVIWWAQTLVKCVAWFIWILSSRKFCVWKGNSLKCIQISSGTKITVHTFPELLLHYLSLVKPDSTILTAKDGLHWRKLLVKLAPGVNRPIV